MKAKYSRFAVVGLSSLLLSACGPSKEAMCDRISKSRTTSGVTEMDERERYVRCLNASDAFVKQLYKELLVREKNK